MLISRAERVLIGPAEKKGGALQKRALAGLFEDLKGGFLI
jgi:hypothetical protein